MVSGREGGRGAQRVARKGGPVPVMCVLLPCTTLAPAHLPPPIPTSAALPCSYILQTRFADTPCAWCYLSASLSAALALTLASGLSRRQVP